MIQQFPFWVYTQKKQKQGLRYLYTHVHGSIIHNSQKLETTRVHWQMTKMWYIYTMEYYSNLKGKGILIRATTCMNVDDTNLSEISELGKD